MSITKTTTSTGERRYRVRYRDPDGQSREKWFTKRADAERYEAETKVDLAKGEYIDPALGKITVAQHMANWIKERIHLEPAGRAKEESLVANHIIARLGDRQLGSLGRTDLQAWISQMSADGLARGSIEGIVTIFKMALAQAVDDKLIGNSPARKGLKLPPRDSSERRFLDHGEVSDLSAAIDPMYRAYVLTGCATGMRPEELAALRIGKKLDLLHRKIEVSEKLCVVKGHFHFKPWGKTDASLRTIDFENDDELAEELERHLFQYTTGQEGELVFTSPQGQPLRPTNLGGGTGTRQY